MSFSFTMQRFQALLSLLIATSMVCSAPTSQNGLTSLMTGQFYSGWNCTLCEVGVKLSETLLHLHLSFDTVSKSLLTICKTFHIEDDKVCQGAIKEFRDEVLTVLDKTELSAKDVCALVFGSVCASSAYDPEVEWAVALPNTTRPLYIPPKLPKPDSPKLRILQIADIHLDLQYLPGGNAVCGEPLCCRTSDGAPSNSTNTAGYWGDYRGCDTPEHTLDNMLSYLAKHEQFDLIYWTGDLPPHNVWNQSRTDQTRLLQHLSKKLLHYFPKTPVYSAVGNHESAPVDSFPPPSLETNFSDSWLYKVLAETWSKWLPKSAQKTVAYAAFYTTSVAPGFRLISINSNFCDRDNFWLLLNVTDPGGELSWLVNVLQGAENNNEKVHIIGHIPPGDSTCYRVWSKNYNKIIVRYASTIRGQFFCHTHYDHYELFYDPVTKEPVSVAYVSPSVTPFYGLNPGFRIYTVDGLHENSSWAVLDHETKILDLSAANKHNVTDWQLEYSAKDMYKLPDLLPSAWHNLSEQLHGNASMFSMFYKHYYKMNVPGNCGTACRDTLLCSLRMSTFGDTTYCDSSVTSSVQTMQKQLKSMKAC